MNRNTSRKSLWCKGEVHYVWGISVHGNGECRKYLSFVPGSFGRDCPADWKRGSDMLWRHLLANEWIVRGQRDSNQQTLTVGTDTRLTVEITQEGSRRLVCYAGRHVLYLVTRVSWPLGEWNPHLLFRVVDLNKNQHGGEMALLYKWSKR